MDDTGIMHDHASESPLPMRLQAQGLGVGSVGQGPLPASGGRATPKVDVPQAQVMLVLPGGAGVDGVRRLVINRHRQRMPDFLHLLVRLLRVPDWVGQPCREALLLDDVLPLL